MEFYSILYETVENEILEENCTMPEFFTDLNLDQIIQEILSDKEEYNLNSFFYQSLKDISTINYRLEVMKEFESATVYNSVVTFSNDMKRVREYLDFSQNLHNEYQREKWLLDAAFLYCRTLVSLNKSFNKIDLKAKGLVSFNDWLTSYLNSDKFKFLNTETNELHNKFDKIKYSVQVDKNKVVVNPDANENDYCASINATFERFNEATFDYQINFFTSLEMCSLETSIVEIVKNMNSDTFKELKSYFQKHQDFQNAIIEKFDREIQFYVSFCQYIERLKRKGFCFAYPTVSTDKRLNVVGGYDLALAYMQDSAAAVVPNDFYLGKEEQIYILTGPNQGGKTTFARAFGQIHFLFSLGCPVPCEKAELSLFDNIFTHFSTEEDLSTNAGRLKEELTRLKKIVERATKNSVIVINELFATTTSYDAYIMGKRVLDHFISLDCICLYVTHIYELSQMSEKTVSLVAAIDSANGNNRTYKITRRPADGCTYANSIVAKYSLSYRQIKERISI